jgi:hypothetical protein
MPAASRLCPGEQDHEQHRYAASWRSVLTTGRSGRYGPATVVTIGAVDDVVAGPQVHGSSGWGVAR